MAEIIYKANFSKQTKANAPEKNTLSLYDTETQEFINLSIAYAKKSKSKIVMLKDMNYIRSQIYITVGMFFGGFKTAFLNFLTKSEDFLIFPINNDPNFSLKISANYNIVSENE